MLFFLRPYNKFMPRGKNYPNCNISKPNTIEKILKRNKSIAAIILNQLQAQQEELFPPKGYYESR